MFYCYSPEGATYRLAKALSAGYRKFFPTFSYLAPSFVVTPFEFMEKLYGS